MTTAVARNAARLLLGAAGVVGALVVWGVLAGVVEPRTSYVPSLGQLGSALAAGVADGSLLGALGASLRSVALGFALAAGAGLVVGVPLGLLGALYRSVVPVLSFLRSVPGIALLPLAILLVGLNPTTVSVVSAYSAFWFVLLNVAQGVASTHVVTLETAAVFEIRGLRRVFRVVLPSALPQVFTGLRLALGISLVTAISAELAVGGDGIGAFVARAQNGLRPDVAFAAIVTVAVVGWALLAAVSLVERRAVPWAGRA